MRFSLWPDVVQPWPDLLEVASHVAAGGWDGVWVADHFMPSRPPFRTPMLECWSVLAGLATTVPRVRLGSLVAGNTYRHPAVLANIAASVDELSGGRVVLGLGAGWQEREHEAYGIELPPVPDRLARLEEACAVVTSLLSQPRADFSGRFYRLDQAVMEPKGAGGRRIPLLVGGGGEQVTLRIVARYADEWNTWGTPEVLEHKGAVLERHCDAIGRDPSTIARCAQVIVDLDGAHPSPRPMPTVSAGVAELQDLLGRYQAAGVDEFIVPDWNLGTGDERRDMLDRFLAEVAAPFRGEAEPGTAVKDVAGA